MSKVLNNDSMSIVFVTAAAVTNTIAFERKPTLHLLLNNAAWAAAWGIVPPMHYASPKKEGIGDFISNLRGALIRRFCLSAIKRC